MLQKKPRFFGTGNSNRPQDLREHPQIHQMAFSSNFGNVFFYFWASIIFPFFPMLPVQLYFKTYFTISRRSLFRSITSTVNFLLKPSSWDTKRHRKIHDFYRADQFDFRSTPFFPWCGLSSPLTHRKTSSFFKRAVCRRLLSQRSSSTWLEHRRSLLFRAARSTSASYDLPPLSPWAFLSPIRSLERAVGLVPLPGSYFPWLIAIILGYCFLHTAHQGLVCQKIPLLAVVFHLFRCRYSSQIWRWLPHQRHQIGIK